MKKLIAIIIMLPLLFGCVTMSKQEVKDMIIANLKEVQPVITKAIVSIIISDLRQMFMENQAVIDAKLAWKNQEVRNMLTSLDPNFDKYLDKYVRDDKGKIKKIPAKIDPKEELNKNTDIDISDWDYTETGVPAKAYTFSAGTPAIAAQVNTNFDNLYNYIIPYNDSKVGDASGEGYIVTLSNSGTFPYSVMPDKGTIIYLQIDSVSLDSTNPPDITITQNGSAVAFDGAGLTDEVVYFSFEIPHDADITADFDIEIGYAMSTGATDTAVMGIVYTVASAGSDLATNTGNDLRTFDPNDTADYLTIDDSLTIDNTDISARGQLVNVKLYRDVDNVSDTHLGDLEVYTIRIKYTKRDS